MPVLPVLPTEHAVGSKPSDANPASDIAALKQACYTKAIKKDSR